MLANIHLILDYDVLRTEDVGLPTKFRFIVGAALCRPLLVNRPRRWPNTNPSLGLLYTLRKHMTFTQCCFKTCLSVCLSVCLSMLIHSLRRAKCCMTFLIPSKNILGNLCVVIFCYLSWDVSFRIFSIFSRLYLDETWDK